MTAGQAMDRSRSFSEFVRDNRDAIIVTPIRIVVIIVLALLVRWLLHRAINRLVRSTADTDVPTVLKPLKERLGTATLESVGLISERRRQRAETVGSLLRSVTSLVAGVLALMLVLGEVGFELGPFIAGAGIVGVALGFGAQNLVKDFLSGMFMILEDQYGVGDVVDLGSATGTVESVGLRITRLRDGNGTLWYARNGEILRVGNHSQGFAQVTIDLPVPYGSDVDAAGDIMQAVADEMVAEPEWAEVVVEEPQLLGVEKIEVDKVVLRLTVKVRPAEQWRVARALRQRVADRLDEMGVRTTTGGPAVRTDPAREAAARLATAAAATPPAATPPAAAPPAAATPPAATPPAGIQPTATAAIPPAAVRPAAAPAAAPPFGATSAGTRPTGPAGPPPPATDTGVRANPVDPRPAAAASGGGSTDETVPSVVPITTASPSEAVTDPTGIPAVPAGATAAGAVGSGAAGRPVPPADGAGGRPTTGPTDSERNPT